MDTRNSSAQVKSYGEAETRKGIRTGLKNKLIWTMLGVGALPLMLAMILSYLQGTKSLQGVIGASFKALAYETSTKIDLLIDGEVSRNIRHAAHPSIRSAITGFNQKLLALDPVAQQKYIEGEDSYRSILESEASQALLNFQKRKTLSVLATRALYITDAFGVLRASVNDFPGFRHNEKPDWNKTITGGKDFVYIGPVDFNEKTESFLVTFAFPILNENEKTIGVLHHVFDAKAFFSGSIEPITFGETGHVMMIDSRGMVVDCPILPTGFLLKDPDLVRSVTGDSPDWVKTMGDGHGGEELSIIGFSPLSQTQEWITRSEGKNWYTFAWQASDELFAPMHQLFLWISMAGIVSILLIGGMGSLAAKKIVEPIRRLQKAAERIGKGEKVEPLEIETGDELEALASEVNQMNDLLQKSFSGLENQVRAKTEEVLYLKEYTESILRSVPDAVVIFDPKMRIEYMNGAFENVAGKTADQLLGHSLKELELDKSASTWKDVQDALINFYSEVIPITSRQMGNQTMQCYTAKDPLAPQHSLQSMQQTVKLDGKVFAFQIFDIAIHDDSGKRLGLLLRDVTEDVDLHNQLAMAEKLSGLGTLAAGIAHELNNPLVSIMGFTEAILGEKDHEKVQEYAGKVFDRSKHMSSIILNMSGYTRSAGLAEEKEVDLNERIDAAIDIAILTSYHNDIKVDRNFSELPPIKAKPEEIQQIFTNLLTNAVQAMDGKGALSISTEGQNGNVLATIRDTGPGIPQEYLSKIYDPFFTTKEQGKGTGLGLNIVHQLVVKHGGKIDVSSQKGKGTTFSLTFPAITQVED